MKNDYMIIIPENILIGHNFVLTVNSKSSLNGKLKKKKLLRKICIELLIRKSNLEPYKHTRNTRNLF